MTMLYPLLLFIALCVLLPDEMRGLLYAIITLGLVWTLLAVFI